MTLTQELAQALRELHDDIADRFDMDSPSTNPGMKHAVAYASAALARYDAEPADRYSQIVGMGCGNSPSCGESAVVWTKDGDMQCAECGHPMTQKTEPPTSGSLLRALQETPGNNWLAQNMPDGSIQRIDELYRAFARRVMGRARQFDAENRAREISKGA